MILGKNLNQCYWKLISVIRIKNHQQPTNPPRKLPKIQRSTSQTWSKKLKKRKKNPYRTTSRLRAQILNVKKMERPLK